MQLVAYGAQDIYLTGNPQITFFKVMYRRHTHFSLESIEQAFNGQVGFGKKITCTISRNGDLIHKMYLRAVLPAVESADASAPANANTFKWVEDVGHALIQTVDVEIGGQRIDRHYGEWLHVWNELTQTAGHKDGYETMIGNHPDTQQPIGQMRVVTGTPAVGTDPKLKTPAYTMYIPLIFWFNRNPGLALPLIALQYHEIKINFEFRPLEQLWTGPSASLLSIGDLSASLFVDYVYMDTDERRRFAQVTHEYLIEQLQYTGSSSITANNTNVPTKLQLNHPCKELIFMVQDARKLASKKYFDFGIPIDGTSLHTAALIEIGASAGYSTRSIMANATEQNPVKMAALQLNGHDRFSERDGMYFNVVQPYQHHERIPATGINVYSFALKPEDHQPSGHATCPASTTPPCDSRSRNSHQEASSSFSRPITTCCAS